MQESESRTAHLREKAKEKFYHSASHQSSVRKGVAPPAHEHVNLFRDVEEGTDGFKKTNEERETEDKETREKYEKSIGYLTYLGQDTQVTSWYQTKRLRDEREIPDSQHTIEHDEESQLEDKQRYDPLNVIRTVVGVQKPSKTRTVDATPADCKRQSQRCVPKEELSTKNTEKRKRSIDRRANERGRKKRRRSETRDSSSSSDSSSKHGRNQSRRHKKHKHKKSSRRREKKSANKSSESDYSSDSSEREEKKKQMAMLREERLKREREEKARAEKLLAKLRGEKISDEPLREETGESRRRQKYNSQYNPHIAKQNKD